MLNQLKHVEEFRLVLADYHVSESAQQVLDRTRLALFVGPSSSGRNTIINELLKTSDYHPIVSDTTRQPRINNGLLEVNGREYWFRTEQEILADLQAGLFLEAAIIHNQQVSGISIRELETAAAGSKVAINEIEVVGADNIHAAKPDTQFFFIIPPSVDEWLTRMRARGALPDDETRRRLTSAIDEISTALERDYYNFVVNDTFKHTAKKINTMIKGEHTDDATQQAAIVTAGEILEDIQTHIANS